MKNNSNIYDVDGVLIRAIDDTHKMTVQEAQEKIENYRKKLSELKEGDPKAAVYNTYMRNLYKYVFDLYSKMSKSEVAAELDRIKANNTDEQVEKAINELKKEVENEESEENEESSEQTVEGVEESDEQPVQEIVTRNQEDLLTDGEGREETVMDEYVDFEEA